MVSNGFFSCYCFLHCLPHIVYLTVSSEGFTCDKCREIVRLTEKILELETRIQTLVEDSKNVRAVDSALDATLDDFGHIPRMRQSVGDSYKERPVVSAPGQNLASTSRDLEVVGMADQRLPIAFDLSNRVHETINSARDLSTRRLYSFKWKVFKSWCLAHAVDPVNCPIGSVLEFLQDKFSAGAATTTLRVYVAAIVSRRDLDNVPLGRHCLVSSFMCGVKRLRPVHPPNFPSWDLSVVLKRQMEPSFELLE